MIFNENLYQLLKCKIRLIDQLLDIHFYQGVPAERKNLYKKILLLEKQ